MSDRSDHRALTRRALRLAAGSDEPDLAGLRAALPEILARAGRERRQASQETTLDAVLPLGRRLLPGLAAAAASLGLAALLFQPSAAEPAAEAWEASLVAQAADEAQAAEIVADAVSGGDTP